MKPEIYRYLEEGEVIQAGDEYQTLAGTWAETHCDTQVLSYSKQGKYRRKVKEEKQKKIEILKPVSVESAGRVCGEAAEKLAFWLMKRYPSGVGYFGNRDVVEIAAMPDHFRKWLVEHGFIRPVKKFEPFTITIETAEECRELWKRVKGIHNGEEMEKTIDSMTLYYKIELHYRKLEEGEDEPD